MVVDPYHRYSYEATGTNLHIYDDFKLKKPFGLQCLYKDFSALKELNLHWVLFIFGKLNKMNRPLGHLCTYRLNWARRTFWGWWDEWDDTVLQTQDSKFESWRSGAEHATSRSRRLPTILSFTRGWGRNIFVSFKPPRPGTEPRTLA